MAETDVHRQNMVDLIDALKFHFAADPMVYVSGNLLLFYERGDRRKHVSPDVFVVRGVPSTPPRKHYLLWEEGKSPDVVIELTSKATQSEDRKKKLALYRDVLKVPEYFLFDPNADWLKPPMQGFRLTEAGYVPIVPFAHRLPSEVLGLHLERNGYEFRLHDPATDRRLPTTRERLEEADAIGVQTEEAKRRMASTIGLLETQRQLAESRLKAVEAELGRAEAQRQLAEIRLKGVEAELERAEAQQQLAEIRFKKSEAEIERLRQEIETLRPPVP